MVVNGGWWVMSSSEKKWLALAPAVGWMGKELEDHALWDTVVLVKGNLVLAQGGHLYFAVRDLLLSSIGTTRLNGCAGACEL